MAEVFIYGLPLIALIAAAFLVYYFFSAAFPPFLRQAHVPNQGVIRRDWVATGRIDFATPITKIASNPEDIDQPTEFKLLVEERRIVESIAGNENLEIQWRLATLREAKAVITQYHKYLSDNRLIKPLFEGTRFWPPQVWIKGHPPGMRPTIMKAAGTQSKEENLDFVTIGRRPNQSKIEFANGPIACIAIELPSL